MSFFLSQAEAEFVTSLGLPWQTLRDANCHWLILSNYPVPPDYNLSEVNVALMIPPGYPAAQIDMAYFFPHLAKLDGSAIGAIAYQIINGIQYQRWSRHRTSANPWRPGIDDISTHLQLINHWFERELKK